MCLTVNKYFKVHCFRVPLLISFLYQNNMVLEVNIKRDIYSIYLECRRSAKAAAKLYRRRYYDRRPHPPITFRRTARNFEERNTFQPKKRVRRRPKSNEDNEITVLAYLNVHPHASSRHLSRESGISKSTISRITRSHNLHPFKPRTVQQLLPGDYVRRINFCNWFIDRCTADRLFYMKILWTDESKFCNNGTVYTRLHYYANENPRWIQVGHSQYVWSINVWVGLIGDRLLGPYFYEENLNGERYLNFLQTQFEEYLEELPVNRYAEMFFQQDGCPAHNYRPVKEYLRQKFGDNLITTNCLDNGSSWPARSPDLTPLDFYLWGYLKHEIYKMPVQNVQEMKEKITNMCRQIDRNVIRTVTMNAVKRARTCLQQNGRHIEQLKM